MKILNQSLLVLTLVTISSTIVPHYHGDSGIGAGLLGAGIGMGVGYAIGKSGQSDSPENSNIRSINQEIKLEQKTKRQVTRDHFKGKITKAEHDEQQAKLDEIIKSLRRQRVMAAA